MVSAMAPGIPFNYDTKSLKLTPPKLVAAGMLPHFGDRCLVGTGKKTI